MSTPRTTISRLGNRANYDFDAIASILDEALHIQVAYVESSEPRLVPTAHVRVGKFLYLHGSVKSHLIQQLADGREACLSVAIMDGLVLARSAMHHSVNYRSVVVHSRGEMVTEEKEKWKALAAFTEKLIPGRWDDIRQPDPGEMKATAVLRFSLDEAVAKIRLGPPSDAAPDLNLPIWGGVIPLRQHRGLPEADEHNQVELPAYLRNQAR